jgi:hypothetical protein
MSFTEVTHESWFSRIGGSIKGILFGFILFLAAFPLLFWNEGRAIKTEKSLEEGAAAVVSVDPQTVAPENEGKLVHTSGMADTKDTLSDNAFKINVQAIQLSRKVLVYQWKEHSQSKTEKEVGGSSTTTTTYSYKREWDSRLQSSSSFKQPDGHRNPDRKIYEDNQWYANQVSLGQFKLNSAQIRDIHGAESLPLSNDNIPGSVHGSISNGEIYVGNPSSPQVGDTRIIFNVVKPKVVSVVAKQTKSTFTPYITSYDQTIQLLTSGQVSAQQMFADEISKNTIMTWILRLVGFLIMTLGFSMILKPIAVLGDVLPFLGNLLGAGIGIISGLISFALSLTTIAIAWFFYRPLLSLGIIAVVVVTLFLLKKKVKKSTVAIPQQAAPASGAGVPPPPPPPPGA